MALSSIELKQRFQQALPGVPSQLKMAPENRDVQLAQMSDKLHLARKSAVMILLFQDQDMLKAVLIRRSEYDGFHSGQMAFPGGKYEESDESFVATALRETYEEIGIPADQIEILGQLTDLFIPPSNFLIKPFVGYCAIKPEYNLNSTEVQLVAELELDAFYKAENKGQKDFYAGALGQSVSAPYYKIDKFEIWGATAMILSELSDLLSR